MTQIYHFPIPKYIPQVESCIAWGKAFSKEECDAIVEECELQEFKKGRVGGTGDGELNEEVRDSDIVWIYPTNTNEWIFHRMASLAGRINFDKFQLDIDCFDGFQYSKYKTEGHYEWHTDIVEQPRNPQLHRKLSFSLMLTEPSEYEGGELLINLTGDSSKSKNLKCEKGDLIMFYSYLPHKVSPVTKGQRISLVTWAMGPKFN